MSDPLSPRRWSVQLGDFGLGDELEEVRVLLLRDGRVLGTATDLGTARKMLSDVIGDEAAAEVVAEAKEELTP